MKKTQFDIYLSAHAAAVSSFEAETAFAVEQGAIAAFTKDGNDAADWSLWKSMFDNRRAIFTAMKAQPAPSVAAANQVAAAAAKAAAPAAAAPAAAPKVVAAPAPAPVPAAATGGKPPGPA